MEEYVIIINDTVCDELAVISTIKGNTPHTSLKTDKLIRV
jgi:hypothetical protein